MTGEDEWSDWEDEDIPAKSLFEDKLLPSAKARVVLFKKTVAHGTVSFRG